MTTQLTIAIVLFVLAGGLTIWANTFLRKAKKIAKEANIKCESAKEEIAELEKRNKNQVNMIGELYTKTPFCNFEPNRYRIEETSFSFDIYATYLAIDTKSTTKILIKRFEFGDDRDFALLEAQELLEHLNDK